MRVCGLCGNEAEGFAEIDGVPMCHGERELTCYQVASLEYNNSMWSAPDAIFEGFSVVAGTLMAKVLSLRNDV